MQTNTQQFLQQLEQEAARQGKLHKKRLLPKQLDVLTTIVGRYSVHVLLVLSVVTALVLEVF